VEPQSLYSHLYYTFTIAMVYFVEIRATDHYLENHERDVSWDKVIEIILTTKNPKKKDDKFEIENNNYYILFEIKDNILYVINAKNIKK